MTINFEVTSKVLKNKLNVSSVEYSDLYLKDYHD